MTVHVVDKSVEDQATDTPRSSFAGFPEAADAVADLIDANRLRGWTVDHSSPWTYVHPPEERFRVQGWKLHVSATVWSAPHVLRACLPVLLRAGVSFKFASTAQDVIKLNDVQCPRGNSGKFVTVYPCDDSQLRGLAEQLHAATLGMEGPAILSDARYLPGSLVHYRYGAFDGYRVLTNDGQYRDCILDPDTNPVEDQRLGVFRPPAWAVIPFDAAGAGQITEGAVAATPMTVVLRDRYEVTSALRHANKGGVYRARDRSTGLQVVIKEARPHVATDRSGHDARDYLRHEAQVLRHLGQLGIAPAVIDEFDQDGHVFLVEEFLSGQRFRDRVDEVLRTGDGALSPMDAAELAVRLARLLRTVHVHGVVVRDLTPNNLIAMPDGTIRLIDLELAAVRFAPDQTWSFLGIGSGTPGISAPEQFLEADPDPRADLFSLGATLLHGVAHVNPDFAEDRPSVRSTAERVAEVLDSPLVDPTVSEPMRRVITGLMRTDPGDRISLAEVIELALAPAATTRRAPDRGRVSEWSNEKWDSLVQGILVHLADTAAPEPALRPWPETSFGSNVEPCTVQHGLAGPLAVAARLITSGVDGPVDRIVEAVIPRLLRHLDRDRHRLPGLYFGFAGTAWALFDAGRTLGQSDLTDRAATLAADLPTVWPNPDVTHGMAGLGLCLLHLSAQTGDSDLTLRALRCAESILDASDPGSGALFWTTPESFDSELAGYRSYGFAHGVAGIGAFLLAAAHASAREDFASAARRCGDTLVAGAVDRNGAAFWPDVPGAPLSRVWWCNGSAGIGSFLCRLYAATGDVRYRDTAVAAARAVWRTKTNVGTAYCHGLAGNGDFLLDLAEATGDEAFRQWAAKLADIMWARRVYRDGRPVLVDESGKNVTAGFGAGLSGHLSFLVRLRFGGPRLFHPAVAAGRPGAPRSVPASAPSPVRDQDSVGGR